jgi:hypothetical protein
VMMSGVLDTFKSVKKYRGNGLMNKFIPSKPEI